jgi:hypothetical protein
MPVQDVTAPLTPAGFLAQPVYEFRDPSGHLSYEFSNVYGPPQQDSRGLICKLDQDRSYWSVIGERDGDGQDQPVRRSVTYADARRVYRGRLTFAHFASEMHMRRELPHLL